MIMLLTAPRTGKIVMGPEMVSTDDGCNNCMYWLIEWPVKKSIKLFYLPSLA